MKHLEGLGVAYYLVGATDNATADFLGHQVMNNMGGQQHGWGSAMGLHPLRPAHTICPTVLSGHRWKSFMCCAVCAMQGRHPCFKFFEDNPDGSEVQQDYK